MESRRLQRLRWTCRRGMKELDVLLEAFIRRESATIADGGWPQLEALLACEDDQLWDWLKGRAEPENPDFHPLLRVIRR